MSVCVCCRLLRRKRKRMVMPFNFNHHSHSSSGVLGGERAYSIQRVLSPGRDGITINAFKHENCTPSIFPIQIAIPAETVCWLRWQNEQKHTSWKWAEKNTRDNNKMPRSHTQQPMSSGIYRLDLNSEFRYNIQISHVGMLLNGYIDLNVGPTNFRMRQQIKKKKKQQRWK